MGRYFAEDEIAIITIGTDGLVETITTRHDPLGIVHRAAGVYARPVLLGGGIQMWTRPTDPARNRDHWGTANGIGSAVAFGLGGDARLVFGTVVFTGTDSNGDIASLDDDQMDAIGDLITDSTNALPQ